MIVVSFYTLMYIYEQWKYVQMTAADKQTYYIHVWPYYVVLGISVSKIFACILWYRCVFLKNTIDLT